MTWKVELAKSAVAELDKLDPQVAKRILLFLYQRVASLDKPPSPTRQRGVLRLRHPALPCQREYRRFDPLTRLRQTYIMRIHY